MRTLLRRLGLDIVRYRPLAERDVPPDLTPVESELFAAVRPFTATSVERVVALVHATRYLVRHGIPGAIVECGVWRGGSVMAVARTLLELGASEREIYLYDTFTGMTEPGELDRSSNGTPAREILQRTPPKTGAWAYASLEEVRANVASTGYPVERLHFIQGSIQETLPDAAPDSIALLRLDTDWYASTRHALVHLYPRLVRRGVLIIDDYGHWLGARRATDEYFEADRTCILLNRIDYTGRIAVKT